MLARNADGRNNGLNSVVFKVKSVLIMSCLLLGKTSGFAWRTQPDDVWKVWVPGTLSVLWFLHVQNCERSLEKNELLIKSNLFLSNAIGKNLWKRREHVLEGKKQKGNG